MVERYVATLDPRDEPVGVERTVSTRSPVLAVSGRVDRIDLRGDDLVVVDYKTGRSVLTTDDARGSLALALYALAAAEALLDGGDPDALFPARPGRMCAWCDLSRSCPVGAAAGPGKRPWDGLAEERLEG